MGGGKRMLKTVGLALPKSHQEELERKQRRAGRWVGWVGGWVEERKGKRRDLFISSIHPSICIGGGLLPDPVASSSKPSPLGGGGGRKKGGGGGGAQGGGLPKAVGLRGVREVGKKDLWLQAQIASTELTGKELREVGGWVGGWVGRGSKGGSNALLDSV